MKQVTMLTEKARQQEIEIRLREKREQELNEKLLRAEAALMHQPSLGLQTSRLNSSQSSSHYGFDQHSRCAPRPQRELVRADHLLESDPVPIDGEFYLTKITPNRHPFNELHTNNRRGGCYSRCENELPTRGRFCGGRGGMHTEDHRGGRGGYRRGGGGDMHRDNMPQGGDYGNNKRGGMMKKRRFNDTLQ